MIESDTPHGADMQVREVMGPLAGSANADDLLRDASAKMQSLGIDPLPVIDRGRVVGVLSRDSIMKRLERDGLTAGMSPVRDAMTTDVTCCYADQDVSEAVDAIEASPMAAAADRVPVIDREGHFVGVASLTSLRRHENELDDGIAATQDVSSVDDLVSYDQDKVDYMSDSSFPASDPPQASPRELQNDEDSESS
jgi:CBS domain-containing protein